jgi:hypothetical protein
MANYKALSENMMHADIRTMDDIYDVLSSEENRKRIAGLFSNPVGVPQGVLSARIESLSTEKLSEVLIEIAKRLAK